MATNINFRAAAIDDLPAIVEMLADDQLGASRERVVSPLPASYYAAFNAITASPNNELIVAELDQRVIGALQLTFIPGLSYQGSWRALVEGVRVASDQRGQGIGHALLEWAISRAASRGCLIVQLTSDKSRTDAQRFYQSLGFQPSHIGMKLRLDQRQFVSDATSPD